MNPIVFYDARRNYHPLERIRPGRDFSTFYVHDKECGLISFPRETGRREYHVLRFGIDSTIELAITPLYWLRRRTSDVISNELMRGLYDR